MAEYVPRTEQQRLRDKVADAYEGYAHHETSVLESELKDIDISRIALIQVLAERGACPAAEGYCR